MVSSNTQASPIFHSRVSLPTRKREGPGRISGRWTSERVLVEPVCGGMWVRGASTEKIAVGPKPGWRSSGRVSSRAAVLGQRAQWASSFTPSFQRK